MTLEDALKAVKLIRGLKRINMTGEGIIVIADELQRLSAENERKTAELIAAALDQQQRQDAYHRLRAENERLRVALQESAMSLRTISAFAGKEDGLIAISDVRGYANSRATVAESALAAEGGGQ